MKFEIRSVIVCVKFLALCTGYETHLLTSTWASAASARCRATSDLQNETSIHHTKHRHCSTVNWFLVYLTTLFYCIAVQYRMVKLYITDTYERSCGGLYKLQILEFSNYKTPWLGYVSNQVSHRGPSKCRSLDWRRLTAEANMIFCNKKTGMVQALQWRIRAPCKELYRVSGLGKSHNRQDRLPNPGKIRMYTSGCPKKQNRCWYRMGSPPPAGSKNDVFKF
jgi:hypothetical protein